MPLPDYVWFIYYTFFALTLVYGILVLIKGVIPRLWSTIAVVGTISFLPLAFSYSFYRPENENEWEHFINGIVRGDPYAWLLLLFFLYLIIWWFFAIRGIMKQGPASRTKS
ncbi:conserved membrane hypothetical protein [[Clostridium] ultunense Esp]|uniref:hypothetical protein n=1 Tax=Thermicanus aegyptius TaxID=94009 RepID=UPI0002B70A59|nr:hypothetical protein [Thermicanus aegyptius]CCQ93349.1 conserved membrane hypothetical protein [[Clostridium] ultunense Esp]